MSKRDCDIFGVGPVIPVPDIAATIRFFCDELGFELDFGEETHPGHGSVMRGRAGVQFTQAPAGYNPRDYPGWFYFFATDIVALCEEFKNRDVVIASEPETKSHGMREFQIEECDGYRLRFGQYL